MKVVYILAGVCIANVVADIIAIKKTKNTEKRLNDKINDLAGVVKTMKKERIDDWFESASDILTSHQESIEKWDDASKARLAFEQNTVLDIVSLDDGIRRNTRRIKEIQEILGNKMGVIFKDEEEDSSDTILRFTKNGTEYHYAEADIKLANELCSSKDSGACEKCPLYGMYGHKEYDCDDILEDYKLYNYKEESSNEGNN
jgi:hypothetical protein